MDTQPAPVRRLDSAPSARAERRRAQSEHADLTAFMVAHLSQDAQVKLSYSDSEELKRLRRAAHAAGKRLGWRIATHARDGAMIAAVNEEPSPLQGQLDDTRLRRTMDQVHGPHITP